LNAFPDGRPRSSRCGVRPTRTGLEFCDEDAVAEVELGQGPEVAVAAIPFAGFEVCLEALEPPSELALRCESEVRDVSADLAVEVRLGPRPVRAEEAVGAVTGQWDRDLGHRREFALDCLGDRRRLPRLGEDGEIALDEPERRALQPVAP